MQIFDFQVLNALGHKASKAFDEDDFFTHSNHLPKGQGCIKILRATVGGQPDGVRVWDVLVLIPALTFLLFLAARSGKAGVKLRSVESPIFRAFYGLVVICAVLGVARCFAAMIVASAASGAGTGETWLWIILRYV